MGKKKSNRLMQSIMRGISVASRFSMGIARLKIMQEGLCSYFEKSKLCQECEEI